MDAALLKRRARELLLSMVPGFYIFPVSKK
jgi:hypothetical protein